MQFISKRNDNCLDWGLAAEGEADCGLNAKDAVRLQYGNMIYWFWIECPGCRAVIAPRLDTYLIKHEIYGNYISFNL